MQDRKLGEVRKENIQKMIKIKLPVFRAIILNMSQKSCEGPNHIRQEVW